MQSPARLFIDDIVQHFGRERAHEILDEALSTMSVVDVASIELAWQDWWARPAQLAPLTNWRTWGFLTGRGFGKTLAISKHINDEVDAGRAMLICLVAQDEQSAIDIQVKGPSGLIATAPPWNKPEWIASELQLVWANGARAYVRTPEVPGKIRGLEYHLSWCSELLAWPTVTRQEAWDNVRLSTRLGYARICWDSTPRKGHPIINSLLKNGADDPETHVVVRGTTHENADNLGPNFVEDLQRAFAGTSRGREELLGEQLEESENAVAHMAWIDAARRIRPDKFRRRGIGLDIAVTSRAGSDMTGIIDAGVDADGQGYILGDYSGRHKPHEWSKIVLDKYIEGNCDVITIETNKGGDNPTEILRLVAEKRGLRVVVYKRDQMIHPVRGVVNVREVYARGEKADRAEPLSVAYEAGRVSHVHGTDLTAYEELITTWEPKPGTRSPDRLDAAVHIMSELWGLKQDARDPKRDFAGIAQAARVLAPQARPSKGIGALLGNIGPRRI